VSKKKLTITKTKTVQGPATNISRNAGNILLQEGFIDNLREHQEIETNFFGVFHSCYMYLLL
jgi:ribosomal protein S8